ncbi:hypothetical protein [uncultured Campylobacter sp.]|uniref:hypothetical protein n=1 Tax=uncultured Campylobacter sp. TaxID=218934 RepID=UPI0026097AEF|nr:hypothetical protein [uncultured Campylobacter sp.]
MLGTKIVMDEAKIIREGRCDLARVYQIIDKFAQECNLVKKDKFTYLCKEDDEQDFPHLGKFTHAILLNQKFFRDNVKEWRWLDDDEGQLRDADLISHIRRFERKGYFK